VRHTLPVILAVAAVLSGARSFAAIGEWVTDQGGPVLAGLGVGTGARPRESTIRRALAGVDAGLLDQVVGAFLWTRTHVLGGSTSHHHHRRGLRVPIKKNQPSLHAACKDPPGKDVPAHRVTTTGHGRRVTGHHYAPPTTLAAWVQGHWSIENRLHRVRDVTYDEDPSQVCTAKRTPSDGRHPQHRHQPATPEQLDQHRQSPTTSRPTPRPCHHMPPDLLRHDFAEALDTPQNHHTATDNHNPPPTSIQLPFNNPFAFPISVNGGLESEVIARG
jgi:DDE_Tnp_1-associated